MKHFLTLLIFTSIGISVSAQQDTVKEEMIYDMPEIMPEFIGGADALEDFIKKNIVYPPDAKAKGIQGKVYIQFVVEKDGTVTNEVVRRGVNPLLDAEALRVAKLLPAFKPGTMRGKKVRVRYTLPIVFSLSA
ncbi:MAG: energy transducer TonB [Crocinitomicaceae bacterium]|nr:energy transducer TonB [Crocinitomicaceae bacterium]MBK9593234.1 energy transducer TonB [Crocinitomicaceae bacterium]